MSSPSWRHWVADLAGIDGAEEDALRPTLLVAAALFMSLGGWTWALFLGWFGGILSAAVCISYTVLTAANIEALRRTGEYRRFRTVQLLLTLLLPFGVQVTMGGYGASAAVVVWSLLAPMGAVLYTDLTEARWWFAAFIGILLLGAVLEPVLEPSDLLPAAWVTVFYVMNILAPTTVAFLLVTFFVVEKNQALDLLAVEQAETERLLLNVLPAQIAAQLRENDDDQVIVEQFDSVSVLFADIVGFTKLSTEMSPVEMIECLNELFSHFDGLSAKYGAEKIRTIGDNYMAACGAPVRRDDHAEALVAMAIEMQDYLKRTDLKSQGRLQFRIGINSGPLVAGVVGRTKFHYDVWGDSVNVASRMESHGEPGRIQVGETTRDLANHRFEFEERGAIEVKGKGQMRTWFVVGRRVT